MMVIREGIQQGFISYFFQHGWMSTAGEEGQHIFGERTDGKKVCMIHGDDCPALKQTAGEYNPGKQLQLD